MDLPSAEDYPDYYEVIDNPISLSLIKRNKYVSKDDFKEAFALMFDNAREYNEAGSQVFEDSNVLQKVFEEEFNKYFSEEFESNANPVTTNGEESNESKTEDKKDGSEKEESGDETENEGFI